MCSFRWQVPQAGAARGACASDPWQVAQSAWPGFVETAWTSAAWHLVHIAGADGGVKSWPSWQRTHGVPPLCAPVSTDATAAWQPVQGVTFASESPCGTWQFVHAPLSACVTWTVAWQRSQELAASAGAWGVWQFVQSACAGVLDAARVGFVPWHPVHTFAPPATKSWGLWHVMHESWPAGFGPAGCAWHAGHVRRAATPGA